MNRLICAVVSLVFATTAVAQWDPPSGQWGKSDPADLRVMTYNIQDKINRTVVKQEGFNAWTAMARIVAAIKPDVLVFQEAGDTGSGVDSVAQLATTVDLFLHGGTDPFEGGQVTAFVQAYAPTFDMPHVFVSTISDGFNRNVILSRFPFIDLNGDSKSMISDFLIVADQYAPGGGGGIRGFAFAEIDLPGDVYAGDLVMGNAHLKAGGSSSDFSRRLVAAQNTAYYIDYLFNGAGTGTPDPNGKIIDSPPATSILGPDTPVVIAGDWNEDEQTDGRRGPAAWLTQAQFAGASDGTDRDRTDSTFDDARDPFTNSRNTRGGSKLDYVAWQDSIASVRRAFIFNAASIGSGTFPPEIEGFPLPLVISSFSDHLPVIADLILPTGQPSPPGSPALLTPADGAQDIPFQPTFTWSQATDADTYDLTIALDASLTQIVHTAQGLTQTSFTVPLGVLDACTTYHWGVTAVNAFGQTPSSPTSFAFSTFTPADLTQDGRLDVLDFFFFVALFGDDDIRADMNGDGVLNVLDFFAFIVQFGTC